MSLHVPQHARVVYELDDLASGDHQVQHVLAVRLLGQLVLPQQVGHLVFHPRYLLLRHRGAVNRLLAADQHFFWFRQEHRTGVAGGHSVGGHHPPGATDCWLLAYAQVKNTVVATDDLGMHTLALEAGLQVWHQFELLAKLKTAKVVDNELIREIYDALEHNGA